MADALRANTAQWPELLAHPAARQRPTPTQWSAAEYACHVRDTFTIFLRRLERMRIEDHPRFDNWDQDATALEDRYDLQDPAVVVGELLAAGTALADAFAAVPEGEWGRTGERSDGAFFTIDSFARYLLHDPVHHVHDITVGYGLLAARGEGGGMGR